GIGCALAARPKLLCLDEPGAGLDAAQSAELAGLLPGLAADGTAILLVDHDMGLVLGSCDRVVVLDSGKVLATGTAAQIRSDKLVVSAYLGRSGAAAGAAGVAGGASGGEGAAARGGAAGGGGGSS
ncbi:MAG: ABC transporter ATP-binding protein, partial [Nocardiopsaceae bacterium]|nr:ABC transporter ATP-binding protein [Nocardiopsaceae bacterium]